VPAGQWFESLARLPEALENFRSKSNNGLKRALIMVPSRGLVANAIAWGYSKYALINPAQPLSQRPVSDLVELLSGVKIQLTFPAHKGQQSKQIRVGTLKSYVPGKPVGRLELVQNGSTHPYALVPATTFALVPDFTPEGDYWEPLADSASGKAGVRNFFNSQQNPMSIIFTELGAYQEELAFDFHDSSLNGTLGVEAMSFEEATRVDRYSDDQHSHFVNSWEHFRQYDEIRDGLSANLEAYRAVVLDGNLSLEALAQRDEFRDRFVLGIFESGRSVLQERGATAFLGEAAYYKPIDDFEKHLQWDAPDGIKIWGWS
jgi:hypothetical protein